MAKKKQRRPHQSPRHNGTGTIRIIGGQWKGRKLPVIDIQGLRPTPDRVRETLFNWLQGWLQQSRCLDLFAGSGAIGFEAASRGAIELVMVEKERKAAQQLADNIRQLNAKQVHLKHANAYDYLAEEGTSFDIIFLDPPFREGHLSKVLESIFAHNLLSESGLIYLEQERENLLDLSRWGLQVHKQTRAGQLDAFLLNRF